MRFKAFLISFLFLVVLICLLFAGVYIGLPRIAETQIKKRLPDFDLPFKLDFSISRITPSYTELTGIRINETPLIENARICYRIRSFKKINIEKLVLCGVTPDIRVDENGGVRVNGFVLPADSDDRNDQPMDKKLLEYLPDRIRVQNSRIHLNVEGKEMLLPFDALGLIQKQNHEVAVKVASYPFGDKVNAEMTVDLERGIKSVQVFASNFDLDHLNIFLPDSAGTFSLKGACDLNLKSQTPLTEWTLDLSSIQTRNPIVHEMKNIGIKITRDNDKVQLQGAARLLLQHQNQVPVQFTGAYNPQLPLPFKVDMVSGQIKQFAFRTKEFSGKIDQPQIHFEAIASRQKAMGSFTFTGHSGKGQYLNDFKTSVSKMAVNTGFSLYRVEDRISIRLKPQADLSDMVCLHPQGNAKFPKFKFGGIVTWSQKDGPNVSILAEASHGTAEIPSKKIDLSDIDFKFPFSYPAALKPASGMFRILTIRYGDQYTLSLKGTTRQTPQSNLTVTGQLDLDQLKGFSPRFNAKVNLNTPDKISADFKFDPVIVTDKAVKRLYKGKNFNAEIRLTLSGNGRLELNKSQITSSMDLKVQDGSVHMPDLKLTAQGINSKIAFSDLLTPETIPGQFLTVEKVDVDKVKIKDVKMRFSIEDAKFFLLENLWFKWCQGIVSTEAIRFPHPENEYSLILYCDRLQLAELLEQMGVFHAEGEGALSGRLPILYRNGDVSFDNGFLFSTPGSGGKVKIANTDKLTAGIPMDSPQFAQLDVAREALKDFDYTWAKLLLDTFEDNLTVKMQLDGKPAKVMPFEYKKELGSFARVKASSPGSHFQGIKLDVNLNLPFNQVMKFGNKLKSIFNH